MNRDDEAEAPAVAQELDVAAEPLLAELARRGFADAEVYAKRGRSRTYERGADRESRQLSTEAGWSIRAGDPRRSLFYAESGTPRPEVALPDPSPHPLLLPELPTTSRSIGRSRDGEPAAPLATENEAGSLCESVERGLARELAGSRLASFHLDDGAAESFVLSTRGARAHAETRVAWLRIEACRGDLRIALALAEREARRFRAEAIARRLADRLAALEPPRGEGARLEHPARLVLAAPLAARLVEAIAPLFVGRAATARLSSLTGANGALGSTRLSLVDDGRLALDAGGVLSSPFDGEGMATGRLTLVEAGRFVAPLLGWWEGGRAEAGAANGSAAPPGCARRSSWRDLPRRAPTQLFLLPGLASAAELVADAGDAVYLIDAEGAVELDGATLTLTSPVSGFRLHATAAAEPLGPLRLELPLATMFAGVREVARDLTFVPGDGLYGAPTLLLASDEGAPGARLRRGPAR